MSHVVGIELRVRDLDALARAIAEFPELEFMRGQRTFNWYGRYMADYSAPDAAFNLGIKPEDYGKCHHAIRMKGNPDAYEIGVVERADGDGYVLVFDFFCQDQNITRIAGGQDLRGLIKEYRHQVVIQDAGVQELLNKGYHIEKDIQENGDWQTIITNE